MATNPYKKRDWVDREVQYPNRRTLTPVLGGQPQVVDIARAEGIVEVEGDLWEKNNMDDMEQRIYDAIQYLTAEINSTNSAVGALTTRVTNNENKISALTTRVGAAETNITNLGSRLTTAEGNIRTNTTNITNLTSRVGSLETSMTSLTNRVSTAEGRITTNASNISANANNISSLSTSLNNLTVRVGATEGVANQALTRANNCILKAGDSNIGTLTFSSGLRIGGNAPGGAGTGARIDAPDGILNIGNIGQMGGQNASNTNSWYWFMGDDANSFIDLQTTGIGAQIRQGRTGENPRYKIWQAREFQEVFQ